MLNQLIRLTKDYIAETDDLIAHRKPGEGLFGMPDSAKNSPCHMEYYHKMEAAVRELAGEEPDAETAETLVRFLLTAEDKFPCSKVLLGGRSLAGSANLQLQLTAPLLTFG